MNQISCEVVLSAIKSGYANLENNKAYVNNLNVFPVPDGDTGTNMALTMQYAVKEITSYKSETVSEALAYASSGALMGARGNSGVILSQLFRGFAKACKGKNTLDCSDIAFAMNGAREMAYKAVMKPTEGTILTVAREMSEFAEAHHSEYDNVIEFTKKIIEVGKVSLDNTPNLLAVLKEAGVVDSGGQGLITIIEGLYSALIGEDIELANKVEEVVSENKFEHVAAAMDADIEFGYCTEFLILTDDVEKYEKYLIEKYVKLGDSLVVVGDEGVIKVHVHTNEPWVAMKIASECGEFSRIKIENMRQQHSALQEGVAHTSIIDEPKKVEYSSEEVDYVLIGVSSGSGLSQILKDLGVTYIIEGGQTMNPSTQDFMDIIENTNAKNYILLPNNKNIILAAEQAKNISDKLIDIVPTKTIPEAIAALMYFDSSVALEDNISQMKSALSEVKTGEVTYAVRDTTSDGKKIKKGDIIGMTKSAITSCSKSIDTTTVDLAKNMLDEESELLTLYYGSEITEEDAQKVAKKIAKYAPDVDVEVLAGNQPIYYYIVSVE